MKKRPIPLNQVAVTASSTKTVGGVAANITQASSFFTSVLYAAFYIIGISLVVASIMRYRDHRMNPSQTPISKVIFMLLAGLFLGFFPLMVKFVQGHTGQYGI